MKQHRYFSADYPNILYHYTSIEAFKSIVENRQIWLSSFIWMNDPNEGRFIEQWIIEEAKRRRLNDELINAIISSYYENFKNYYFLAFSENGDLLSQWRAYAEDSTGFSIGFDPTFFTKVENIPVDTSLDKSNKSIFTQNLNEEALPATYGIAHVIYAKEEQQKIVKEVFDYWLHQFSSSSDQENIILLGIELTQYGMVFKDPGFKEEREWRLLYLPYERKACFNSVKEAIQRLNIFTTLQFRRSRNRLVGYYRVAFDEFGDGNPIKEIIMGSRNDTLHYDLSLLLNYSDYSNVVIKNSEIAYR